MDTKEREFAIAATQRLFQEEQEALYRTYKFSIHSLRDAHSIDTDTAKEISDEAMRRNAVLLEASGEQIEKQVAEAHGAIQKIMVILGLE